MVLGMPIAIALGLSSLLTILFFAQDSLASLALKLYETSRALHAARDSVLHPGGAFMTTGGVARRMIRFANACVGHLRGGLAMASVLACMLFAAVSGSSPGDRGRGRLDRDRRHGAGRLPAGVRRRRDLQRRHAGHPDPAVDRDGGLRRGDRNLGRQAVHGRRHSRHPARADADGRDLRARAGMLKTCRAQPARSWREVLRHRPRVASGACC